VKYTRIAPAFTDAGLPTILLKGPAFDQLLFDGTRARTYADIDLLVDPARVATAERVLGQLGFHRAATESAVLGLARRAAIAVGLLRAAHATAWTRQSDGFTIDLHHTLPLISAPAEQVWHALGAHMATVIVVGADVRTLDRPASAMLIALHAAHHGPRWNRARADLQRGCDVLDDECWQAAALLARKLGAERALAIGLGTTEQGRAVARELGLRTEATPIHRLMWWGSDWMRRLGQPRA
jgi:putative nucleotidyltransferase-like protein